MTLLDLRKILERKRKNRIAEFEYNKDRHEALAYKASIEAVLLGDILELFPDENEVE